MDLPRKTRDLKKYEAEPLVCVSEGEMDYYSPFGPMIAKTTLSAELVQRINLFADGVVAYQPGKEFILPKEFVFDGDNDSLAQQMARLIHRYLSRVENGSVSQIQFEAFWVVSQHEGMPSPVHFHSGDVSGVVYLKVPEITNEEAEEAKTYISGRQAGYINFLSGGKQRLAKTLISFKPQVGDLYIFPGWLLHGAEPFRGHGERRSMSFNAFAEPRRQ